MRLIPKRLPRRLLESLPTGSSFDLYTNLLPQFIPLLEWRESRWFGIEIEKLINTPKGVLVCHCVFFGRDELQPCGSNISQSCEYDSAVVSTYVGFGMQENRNGTGLIQWSIASSSILFFIIEQDTSTFEDEIM